MAGVLCRFLLSHKMVSRSLEMSIAGTFSRHTQICMWMLGVLNSGPHACTTEPSPQTN